MGWVSSFRRMAERSVLYPSIRDPHTPLESARSAAGDSVKSAPLVESAGPEDGHAAGAEVGARQMETRALGR